MSIKRINYHVYIPALKLLIPSFTVKNLTWKQTVNQKTCGTCGFLEVELLQSRRPTAGISCGNIIKSWYWS
jgi:hypothetical protein